MSQDQSWLSRKYWSRSRRQTGAFPTCRNDAVGRQFSEISCLQKDAQSRVVHIHRNEPGVIARMNAAFAANGLNIAAQQLQTRGEIGYAMTDVDAPVAEELMMQLRSAPATIRCELL